MAGHVRPGVCVCACRRCLRTVHVEHEDLDRPSSVAQSHLALRVARGHQLSRRDLRQRCQLLQQRQVHRRCRPWSRGRRLCFLWSAGDQASLEQSLHCASRQCEQLNSGNWRLRTSSRQPAKAQAQLRGLHLFEKCSEGHVPGCMSRPGRTCRGKNCFRCMTCQGRGEHSATLLLGSPWVSA